MEIFTTFFNNIDLVFYKILNKNLENNLNLILQKIRNKAGKRNFQ